MTTPPKRNLAILGSTGSIGTQALGIVRNYPDQFGIEVLTAQGNCDLLIQQAVEFVPNVVVIGNEKCYPVVKEALKDLPVKVYTGQDAIAQVVEMDDIDMVLTALVGYAGLKPTLNAIRAGKPIALANKETLVVAGDLVTEEARKNKVPILPVDSEHSAIFQCLTGENPETIEKIVLTASGGPFLGKTREQLSSITIEDALCHPNWKMGNKITIDSASMMNKGLEAIEACWLFNLRPQQVEVVIHPQSVVHSMVQFTDGSVKAQMGVPDMQLPILYALSFPHRIKSELPRLNFHQQMNLTFEPPDFEVFRNLTLAFEALRTGGNMPCILNAANESAVSAFLNKRIGFLEIPVVVEYCMKTVSFIKKPGYQDYVATHHETMACAGHYIQHQHH